MMESMRILIMNILFKSICITNAYLLLFMHCWYLLSNGPDAILPEYGMIFNQTLMESADYAFKFETLWYLITNFYLIPIHPEYLSRKWNNCTLADAQDFVAEIIHEEINFSHQTQYLARAVVFTLDNIGVAGIAEIPFLERMYFIRTNIDTVIMYFQDHVLHDVNALDLCFWFINELKRLDQMDMIAAAIRIRTDFDSKTPIYGFGPILCNIWMTEYYNYSDSIIPMINERCVAIINSIALWRHSEYQSSMDVLASLKFQPGYEPELVVFILDFTARFGFFGSNQRAYFAYKANVMATLTYMTSINFTEQLSELLQSME